LPRLTQSTGRRLIAGIPTLWLLLLFLIPFLIVFRISLSEVRLAIPPYTPLVAWHHGKPSLELHWSAYSFLFTDPLYVSSYLYSLKVAAVSTLCCLLIGYPMAYAIARARPSTRTVLLMLIVLPFWTSFLLRVYAWIGLLKNNGVINNVLLYLGVIHQPLALLQTDFAVYIGIVYSYLPFVILPLYTNLEKHDPRRQAAARIRLDYAAAVARRHPRRVAAGVHPGGGRVRDTDPARTHRSAHDRPGAVG
jgi:putrescine transport system permease protein